MKKYAVIDIGSNSVRLLKYKDGISEKKLLTTRLGKNLVPGKAICRQSFTDTVNAVKDFYAEGKQFCNEVLVFATEAVRSASNGKDLVAALKNEGICVDVVGGDIEASLAFLGAVKTDEFAGVIDIGGASTEIVTGKNKKILNSLSIPLGAVRLFSFCNDNILKIENYVKEINLKNITIPEKIYAVGGTATTLAAVSARLRIYDPAIVDGYILTRDKIKEIADKMVTLSIIEREKIDGLPKERADIIVTAAYYFYYLLEKLSVEKITVSESDNLEGYLKIKNLI